MDCNLQGKRSLLQHKTAGLHKVKVETPRESKGKKLGDEIRELKPRKPKPRTAHQSDRSGTIDGESSIPSLSSINNQKPWPNNKALAVEELVKHMSNVPCYLQRTEQGEDVHKKALNFGVIDWGSLEKWAYHQKKDVNRRIEDSPSSGDTSSPFSTFRSSSDQSGSSSRSRRHSNVESSTFNGDRKAARLGCNSFSGKKYHEDNQFSSPSYVPNSCPLLSTDRNGEPWSPSTSMSEIVVPIRKSKGRYEKEDQFTEEFVPRSEVDGLGQVEITGESANNFLSTGMMNKSYSLRERSSSGPTKQTPCPDNSHKDKEYANNRSRNSPLRRILDPLLKLKNHIPRPTAVSTIHNVHEPSVAGTPRSVVEESTSRHRPTKSVAASIDFATSQAKGNLNSSNQASRGSHNELHEQMNVPPNRQALLRFTWKNETPMFMLSSNDGNVLVATMRENSFSDKGNSECIYAVTSLCEVKKKSGMWTSHGNKSKKHGLVSTVVGELKVSGSKFVSPNSKGYFVMREFVLFGAELVPSSNKTLSSRFNSELAAILIKIPEEGTIGDLDDVLNRCNCRDWSPRNSEGEKCSRCQEESLHMKQNHDHLRLSSITALLPVKVHGMPVKGEPSRLIERWKYGGNCDCGGWDEGCILTVLFDEEQGSVSSGATQAVPGVDGTNRIELFVQGRTRESRHAFNMVRGNEGLHTVEFNTSITLLQAFAICIAILHNRKLSNPSPVHESVEAKRFQKHVFADSIKKTPATTRGGAPTSYVPHHPPLSPVGRA